MPSAELHSSAYPLENEHTSYTNLFLLLSSSVSLSLFAVLLTSEGGGCSVEVR